MPARRRRFAMVPAVVLAMYMPVVLMTYGFADDYASVRDAGTGNWSWTVRTALGNGRPVTMLLYRLGFGITDGVGSLRWLRLVSVVGVAGVALAVALLAAKSGRSFGVAAAMGVAAAALPPMQVVAAWATLFNVSLAVLVAMWASWRAQDAATRPHVIEASVAMAVAMLCYQPAAMAYWLPIVIAVTGPIRTRQAWRNHAVVLACGLAAGAVGWVVGLPMQVNHARAAVSFDFVGTGRWFAEGALPRVLLPFSLHPVGAFAAVLGGVLLVGLVRVEGWRRAVALLALLPAAYLPSLAVGAGSAVTARTMVALGPVTLVLAVRAFEGLLPHTHRRIPRTAGVAAAGLLAFQACAVAWVFIARPAHVEWQRTLQATASDRAGERFVVVPAQPSALVDAGTVPSNSRDEFGLTSSWYSFAAPAMVELAVHAHTGHWPRHVSVMTGGVAPTDARVVDFEAVLTRPQADGHQP